MAPKTWKTCGLCGRKAKFIGSHAMNHLPYIHTLEDVTAILAAERSARKAAGK